MKYKVYGGLWLIGAFIAQVSLPWAVAAAYAERGYWAIGGEWGLLIVAIVAVCFSIDNIVKGFNEEYAESSIRHKKSIKRLVKRLLR